MVNVVETSTLTLISPSPRLFPLSAAYASLVIDNTPMFVSRRAPGDAKHSSCRLRFHPH